jgi:hypothetical protein
MMWFVGSIRLVEADTLPLCTVRKQVEARILTEKMHG